MSLFVYEMNKSFFTIFTTKRSFICMNSLEEYGNLNNIFILHILCTLLNIKNYKNLQNFLATHLMDIIVLLSSKSLSTSLKFTRNWPLIRMHPHDMLHFFIFLIKSLSTKFTWVLVPQMDIIHVIKDVTLQTEPQPTHVTRKLFGFTIW